MIDVMSQEDTASAIFNMVRDNWAKEPPAKIISRIAYDLRKAKADGMRNAALMVTGRTANIIRVAAGKIEKGET